MTAANASVSFLNDGACVMCHGVDDRTRRYSSMDRGITRTPLARIRGFGDAAQAPANFTTHVV